ncbi:MAG: amino acid ABC transporter permease [Pseudodesulfovibrio sp.]|uniref:Polar amino acid ABC transporter, inner membrane subunit n=1 Tax=Pseudodesulfovibrio aespoeensis (strain ATCC 700646 / DSM 10631 / Aspo-2) TaxID=643562 RepID=E6VS56_PSEA9|nr:MULTISPECIES: amino acid ABC transporter permease [Pseudodesulfovibrio]MBU4243206.1 amino acid ABC transporter permease [Pseudomonadota bacterium]ADU63101.1 polar amino acid ABC transporter, inner membrane subunit [Pseudodesulfovibrio aespoeensis Aspo-2]MBU4379634.1 amino acid ABC transporter permease [Pseudomonadota bacterium]MBU4474123.1 amino acid ABC transporter permease [Pseudomonadota bacterium]MBU4516809.1 amino acid ABC transporter permease [Pseudomonadota bacterium]
MAYNFNWKIMLSGEPAQWMWEGLVTTMQIATISLLCAMLLGIVICVFRMTPFKLLQWFSLAYTEFFRNTPLLVQIFFWYNASHFVLPEALNKWMNVLYYWFPGPFTLFGHEYAGQWMLFNVEFMTGVIALTVYTSAFIAEEIRAGIFSIPKTQIEASRAVGLSFTQAYRYVILPQALRIVIPPLISQSLNLIKNSSLCMVIGVTELMFMARQVESYHGAPFEAFSAALLIYLVISLFVSFGITMYNKHFLIQVRY